MQILHISDTHLGKRQYGQEFREQDIYEVFNQLIDIAIKEHVDAIIHTGDLFDVNDPPNRAEYEAVKALKRLKEHNIPFIVIAGDHDTPKRSSSLYPQRLLEELDLIKFLYSDSKSNNINTIRYTLGDIYIYGISHMPNLAKEKLKERLSTLKPEGKKSILMLHQGLKEILPYEGAWQIGIGDLPKGFSYYAVGHFHTRVTMHLDGGRILEIAGSPDIMREEEIEGYEKHGKGATLIDFSKEAPEIQTINIEIRKQLVEEINTTKLDEEIKRVSNKLKQYAEKKPILHVILTGISVPKDHLNRKLETLRQYASLVRIYKDETKTQQEKNIELPSDTKIDNLIVEYLIKMEGFTKDEAYVILDIIKHSEDKEYVKNQLKKMLGVYNDNKEN